MEMTAFYSDSSPGAWREEVFESKLLNVFWFTIAFSWMDSRGVDELPTAQGRRLRLKTPEFHAWL